MPEGGLQLCTGLSDQKQQQTAGALLKCPLSMVLQGSIFCRKLEMSQGKWLLLKINKYILLKTLQFHIHAKIWDEISKILFHLPFPRPLPPPSLSFSVWLSAFPPVQPVNCRKSFSPSRQAYWILAAWFMSPQSFSRKASPSSGPNEMRQWHHWTESRLWFSELFQKGMHQSHKTNTLNCLIFAWSR